MKVNCSIVIPTRNCIKYLPLALASIDVQGRDDLEVIVVDDGSTDGTGAWLAAIAPSRPNLRVIATDGIGVAAARNAALAAAKGEYIAFLDADDTWWPNKLDRQLAFMQQRPEIVLTFTDYLHVRPDSIHLGTCFEFWNFDEPPRNGDEYGELHDAQARLLATNVVGTSTVLARRDALEAVGGFSTDCRSAEDWDLWLRLAGHGAVGCSRAITASYLMRPNSETASRRARIDAMRDIVRAHENLALPGLRAAVRTASARILLAEAEVARLSGRLFDAAVLEAKAFLSYPTGRGLRALLSVLAGAVRINA